jgi:carboxypeptidase family protein
MKKLIMTLLVLPIMLFAGDPIPGLDITVEQSPNGETKTGKTNGRGEFIATGLKEGDYKITIELNGVKCVIGDKVNEKITVPSSKSTASIKPIRLELSSRSMYLSKKGYDYYASNTREAGSGMATGKRQHKPITVTKELDKSSTKSSATDHNSSRSNKTSSAAELDTGGEDNDCDGIVEITPMKGGQIKIKVTCDK